MADKLLEQFRSLNAWQCRVFHLDYLPAAEEIPDTVRGNLKKYRMGYLYLTRIGKISWDLTLKKGELEFNIGGNGWGMGCLQSGITRTWVESVLFWNHFLDIRSLDMYRKVLGHLQLHPELVMVWAASKSRLFHEAALEVLGGR